MPTLLHTIKAWADGYNALLRAPVQRREDLGPALRASVIALRRHSSLADLASAYCAGDYLIRLAEELYPDCRYAAAIREASYWLRFMEIRHGHLIT